MLFEMHFSFLLHTNYDRVGWWTLGTNLYFRWTNSTWFML